MTHCPRCGKTLHPDSIHTCSPKALVLADILEKMPLGECDYEAAAELRRLFEENEALRNTLRVEESISFRRQMQEYAAQVEKDEALLRQATECLEAFEGLDAGVDNLITTLRARIGETT